MSNRKKKFRPLLPGRRTTTLLFLNRGATTTLLLLLSLLLLSSCSMTKGIPDGEQLFTGLTKITYEDEQNDDPYAEHLITTKEEIEAALATAPNGSLFGSSYYSIPWSWRLWVYNKYSSKDSKFAKWMTKTFGRPPVLMSQVNPALRASVARSVLQNNGYFRGTVTYDEIPQKNPKKCKIGYTVHLDSLFTLDSVSYVNFPDTLQALIDSTKSESLIPSGSAFSLSQLDGERSRISNLFRNNGYYYYNGDYASYLADTFQVADKVQLRFQLANNLSDEILKKWYVGNMAIQFRKNMREQLTDSIRRRHLILRYNGDKPPMSPRMIFKDLKIRPRQQYSYDNYLESANKINAAGVFSSTDFNFTPRPDTDTLDLTINCVFEKPYDFYFECNAIGKTIGRFGPEAKIGFTRRNLFHGGEKLDINLHGSYEWEVNSERTGSTYQYGADASIEFPRIIAPFYNSDRIRRDKNGRFIRRRRPYAAPTTLAKVSTDIIRRPDYYKMHIVSGEWTYRWQPTFSSRHEFSPLTLKYQFKNSTTAKFDSLMYNSSYISTSLDDYFIPKMRYTYTYNSPPNLRNPIRWETTIEEAGNALSLLDMARGKSFDEKEKKLFKTPYAQFVHLETDLTKKWSLGKASSLVAHLNAGYIWSYGNSDIPPFSERFYAGGANSIRAFSVREVGPGAFDNYGEKNRQMAYLLRNGDLKLIGNLEYRTPIFGNLHGAIFLDAGNIWCTKNFIGIDEDDIQQIETSEDFIKVAMMMIWEEQMKFNTSTFLDQIAIGTGFGLRYDLGFLVVRVDWGIALHYPYYTGSSGYFSAPSFKDRHTIHFAIGYPF